ncbi:hypothetical protein K440DRAFT_664617 [Wilcoxina mikolae CBS 423.85]|nr:hypothetical protein K440DRAFT_664617 [Wilcoxina mikolae CBS 423.85]
MANIQISLAAVDLKSEAKLVNMDQSISGQFSEIQRRQEIHLAQLNGLCSTNDHLATFIPKISESLDKQLESLDDLHQIHSTLHQHLRETLRDEMRNFIPVIEESVSAVLRNATQDHGARKSRIQPIGGRRNFREV